MSKGDGNFWLTLHQLAEALEGEGKTRSERQDSLLDDLLKMRPIACDALRDEYEFVVDELVAMRPAVRRKKK